MTTVNADLVRRLLAVLPVASERERPELLCRLVAAGGDAIPALVAIVDGTTRASASDRAMAIQEVGAHPSAKHHLALFEQALSDRDLFVQCLALVMLRRVDGDGVARASVTAWLKRRLKGRTSRVNTDFREIPLAVGYFTDVDDLPTLASLLAEYDDQLDEVGHLVLDHMWPRTAREEWARGAGEQRPDLTGLGEYGHSDQFYLRLDAQVAGIASVELPPELTAEQEAQLDLETNAAFEEFFEKQLIRLERRLTQGP